MLLGSADMLSSFSGSILAVCLETGPRLTESRMEGLVGVRLDCAYSQESEFAIPPVFVPESDITPLFPGSGPSQLADVIAPASAASCSRRFPKCPQNSSHYPTHWHRPPAGPPQTQSPFIRRPAVRPAASCGATGSS